MVAGITPDDTEPQAWRQTAGWGYGGILAQEPGDIVYDWYINNDGVTYYQNDGVDWYVTRNAITSKTLTHSGDIVHLETVTHGVPLCETTRGVEIGK